MGSGVFLSADGLYYTYPGGQAALRGAGVEIEKGRLVAIAGPNGSGKSTMLRVLAGIIRPDSGVVKLADKPLSEYSNREAARLVGFLPQETVPAFDFTAGEVVMTGRYPRLGTFGLEGASDAVAAGRVMRETSTWELRDRPFAGLSGGERRRVLIASVLAGEPEALLLDEPTNALDIRFQVEVYALLKRLAGDGLAVAVVTHDLNLASGFADWIVLLSNGGNAASGAPGDVLTKEILEPVYNTGVVLASNPETGSRIVLPRVREDGE